MVDGLNLSRWQRWLGTALATFCSTASMMPHPARAQEVEPAAAHSPKLSDDLYTELRAAAAPVSFLVMLADQVDPEAVAAAAGVDTSDALARRKALYQTLTAHALRTQAGLRAELDAAGVRYRPFYIVNMVQVWGDLALAERLSRRPEVRSLERNPALPALQTPESGQAAGLPPGWKQLNGAGAAASAALPWGLTAVHADKVWDLGYRGAGIVVASQDTGVQWDHPALVNTYRGQPAMKIYLPIIANNVPGTSLAAAPERNCGDCRPRSTPTTGTISTPPIDRVSAIRIRRCRAMTSVMARTPWARCWATARAWATPSSAWRPTHAGSAVGTWPMGSASPPATPPASNSSWRPTRRAETR